MKSSRSLDELSAFHEIQQLAYRYAHAWATRDYDLMLSLWAETDAPPELPSFDIHFVRHGLATDWDTPGARLLHVTNHIVELDAAAHAHGNVHCLAQLDLGDLFVDQTILYRDRYVCRGGRWLFLVREHLLWFGQTRDRHPRDQPAAEWPQSQIGRGILLDNAL